ncbi:Rha family transcriptional regulator [Acinetobacter bereziniae]|uniref:Rha family transcriptional regulator n=1 Tax=Acinetobacter bereziniae TaxID=106648 RepID=UPI00258157AE|nr:Rha family transcriptional regulator [Acinetobacter bereziniae]
MNTSFALTAHPTLHLDWVNISEQQITTTSLKVAEAFGKLHKNVIQRIEKLDCSPEFTSANFSAHVQTIEIGNGATRESKFYQMTKDGFMFLVMGFTGKEAAAVKEKFIAVFNHMAEYIKQQIQNPTTPQNVNVFVLPENYKDIMFNRMTIQDFFKQNYNLTRSHSLPQDIQQTLMQFWLVVKILLGFVPLNHSPYENELWLNLRQIYRIASQLKHQLPPHRYMCKLLRLSADPLFIRIQAVHSTILSKTIKCWKFSKI